MRSLQSVYRAIVFAICAVCWLIPMFWIGVMGKLPVQLPPRVVHQYGIARLFPKRAESSTQPFIQVKSVRRTQWTTVYVPEFSPLEAFGYRQRLDLTLQFATGRKVAEPVRTRLAAWLAVRYRESHPLDGEVTAVRFGQAVWQSSSPEMAMPAGRWQAYPASLPKSVRMVWLATYDIKQGKATLVTAPKALAQPSVPVPKVFRRKAVAESASPATPP